MSPIFMLDQALAATRQADLLREARDARLANEARAARRAAGAVPAYRRGLATILVRSSIAAHAIARRLDPDVASEARVTLFAGPAR